MTINARTTPMVMTIFRITLVDLTFIIRRRVRRQYEQMEIVRFDRSGKTYESDGVKVPALHDVSLQIGQGEFVALVGRSGCGKSTLLNLAGAMDFPTSGSVWVCGANTTTLSDSRLTQLRRDTVGFIFQAFQLLPT